MTQNVEYAAAEKQGQAKAIVQDAVSFNDVIPQPQPKIELACFGREAAPSVSQVTEFKEGAPFPDTKSDASRMRNVESMNETDRNALIKSGEQIQDEVGKLLKRYGSAERIPAPELAKVDKVIGDLISRNGPIATIDMDRGPRTRCPGPRDQAFFPPPGPDRPGNFAVRDNQVMVAGRTRDGRTTYYPLSEIIDRLRPRART